LLPARPATQRIHGCGRPDLTTISFAVHPLGFTPLSDTASPMSLSVGSCAGSPQAGFFREHFCVLFSCSCASPYWRLDRRSFESRTPHRAASLSHKTLGQAHHETNQTIKSGSSGSERAIR